MPGFVGIFQEFSWNESICVTFLLLFGLVGVALLYGSGYFFVGTYNAYFVICMSCCLSVPLVFEIGDWIKRN